MKRLLIIPSPTIWYIAAGYKLPAGIEAYLLHYATELRNQGFGTRIIVFEPLPKVPHRFLVALRERGIPIESLYERVSRMARVLTGITYVPWMIRKWAVDRRQLAVGSRANSMWEGRSAAATGSTRCSDETIAATERASHIEGNTLLTSHISRLTSYWRKRLAVHELKHMIEQGKPDVIHVKGRLITEAWPVFPSEKTIYQHALMGTRDPSWEDNEAEAFSVFLNRVARVLVQGKGIAETFAQAFNIRRKIDVVFTMAPDEISEQWTVGSWQGKVSSEQCAVGSGDNEVGSEQWAVSGGREKVSSVQCAVSGAGGLLPVANCQLPTARRMRFGILCRFTEQKGIAYILEALRMYNERHGAVDFTFAGQGPLEGMIQKTVGSGQWAVRTEGNVGGALRAAKSSDMGLECTVAARSAPPTLESPKVFSHSTTDSAMSGIRIVPVTTAVDILRELDVFVHPGLDDAMPVSIVEALMCGVPCIVSNVGASPELVRDGVEGIVIEPASAEQICEAMERFAAMTGEEVAGYKERARARYEEACRPEVVGAQVAGIYRGVMGGG